MLAFKGMEVELVARRRGFFAELQHQAAVAERERERTRAALVRDNERRKREAERATAAARRSRDQAQKADAKSRAQAEAESKRLHVAARELEVESLNADLDLRLAEIDDILNATLTIDDYVDLNSLRQVAEHPPFESPNNTPVRAPLTLRPPSEPEFVPPVPPSGLSGVFGKKKHADAVASAQADFWNKHAEWDREVAATAVRQQELLAEHTAADQERLRRLELDRAAYDLECRDREAAAVRSNLELDELIRHFAAGTQDAVEEYFSIVLSNSIYPDDFPLGIEFDVDTTTAELTIALDLPRPDQLPTVRTHKYVKAKDEIVTTEQTQKEQRDRFTAMLHNVTLRTLHEIWEADRTRRIATISFTAGVSHIDPATGQHRSTKLLAVAAEREEFLSLNLARVTPTETLAHLGATVSKNPWALAPIPDNPSIHGR